MTPLAIRKVIRSEGSLVVVTGHAALRAGWCAVHCGNGFGHLTSRGNSRANAMTFITI